MTFLSAFYSLPIWKGVWSHLQNGFYVNMSKMIFLLNKAVTRLYKIVVHQSTNPKIYCLLNNKKTTGQMKNCFKALFVQMPQGTPKDILLLSVAFAINIIPSNSTIGRKQEKRVLSRYLINYTLIWIYWVKFSLWTILLVTRIEHRSIADKFRNPWALIAKENNVPYSVGFGFLFLFDDNKVTKSIVLDCFESFNDSPSRSVHCQFFNRFCSYDRRCR